MGLNERITMLCPVMVAGPKPTGARVASVRLLLARAVPALAVVACAYSPLPAQAAEVYRWIDERGVVNYSNEAPPKTAKAKDVRIVEDRLSVYTPEKPPERPPARADKVAPGAVPGSKDAPPAPRVQQPPPPPAPLAYDPCANVADPSACYGALPYGSPVIVAPRRPPRLVQPELPPGTIAGQSAGSGGIIPGQSGTTPPAATSSRSRKDEPSASFTVKGNDRERERDSRP
jgi:hypothetical protein